MRNTTIAASMLSLLVIAGAAPGASAARGRADLQHVRPPAVAKTLPRGELAAVVVRVRNAGGRRARPTTLRLYLSADAKRGKGDRRLPGRWHVHKLRPRHVAKVRLGVWIAETTRPGRYHLLSCADDRRVVRERDERDNCASSRVRIVAPPRAVEPVIIEGTSTTVAVPAEPPAAAPAPPAPPAPEPADRDDAVYVSATGSDSDPGTSRRPKQTIRAGILAAKEAGKDVHVAQGTYPERVFLADGVSIHGGFLADWTRSDSADVRITGGTDGGLGHTEAVHAASIVSRTVLADVTLAPRMPDASGASSYGLFAVGAPGLVLEDVTVQAAPGQRALEPRVDGRRGADGSPGLGDQGCRYYGSPGGTGRPHAGGRGGEAGFGNPTEQGHPGTPGAGPGGGAGGPGGDANGGVGGAGESGAPGANGSDGRGGVGGTMLPYGWVTASGVGGASGGSGSGGGGGGGGGSDEGTFDVDPGNAGGGGGGGGEGGGGGGAGRGGGGSFGVVLQSSTGAVIRDSHIAADVGGAGGPGGDGAQGGIGGAWGLGGILCDGGDGGRGGMGGYGGWGGDGGGGAGGPSIALYLRDTQITPIDTVLSHATGGAGGRGGGGLHGAAGAAGATN